MDSKVKVGFTIWARQTLESEIFFYKPDKWFKIWFFIVNRVNHQTTKLFKRGEGIITYKEIMTATGATKKQVEGCVGWLEKESMLESTRTTRGRRRFVVNYARFQDVGFYKKKSKGDKGGELEESRGRAGGDLEGVPIGEECNNDKNVNNEINRLSKESPCKASSQDFDSFLTEYIKISGRKVVSVQKRKQKYKVRRKVFTAEQLVTAMRNMFKDPFMVENNYATIDYILRNDENVEKYLNPITCKKKLRTVPPSATFEDISLKRLNNWQD